MESKVHYIAVMNNPKSWDSNEQTQINENWEITVKIAKAIAKVNKKCVRVSDSKGYNNQGHYFSPHN